MDRHFGIQADPATTRKRAERATSSAGSDVPARWHRLSPSSRRGKRPPSHAWLPGSAGSPLADALAALAAAVHAARIRLSYGLDLTWPLLGTLGLGHALMPAPGG
jgi:hypothetical protein